MSESVVSVRKLTKGSIRPINYPIDNGKSVSSKLDIISNQRISPEQAYSGKMELPKQHIGEFEPIDIYLGDSTGNMFKSAGLNFMKMKVGSSSYHESLSNILSTDGLSVSTNDVKVMFNLIYSLALWSDDLDSDTLYQDSKITISFEVSEVWRVFMKMSEMNVDLIQVMREYVTRSDLERRSVTIWFSNSPHEAITYMLKVMMGYFCVGPTTWITYESAVFESSNGTSCTNMVTVVDNYDIGSKTSMNYNVEDSQLETREVKVREIIIGPSLRGDKARETLLLAVTNVEERSLEFFMDNQAILNDEYFYEQMVFKNAMLIRGGPGKVSVRTDSRYEYANIGFTNSRTLTSKGGVNCLSLKSIEPGLNLAICISDLSAVCKSFARSLKYGLAQQKVLDTGEKTRIYLNYHNTWGEAGGYCVEAEFMNIIKEMDNEYHSIKRVYDLCCIWAFLYGIYNLKLVYIGVFKDLPLNDVSMIEACREAGSHVLLGESNYNLSEDDMKGAIDKITPALRANSGFGSTYCLRGRSFPPSYLSHSNETAYGQMCLSISHEIFRHFSEGMAAITKRADVILIYTLGALDLSYETYLRTKTFSTLFQYRVEQFVMANYRLYKVEPVTDYLRADAGDKVGVDKYFKIEGYETFVSYISLLNEKTKTKLYNLITMRCLVTLMLEDMFLISNVKYAPEANFVEEYVNVFMPKMSKLNTLSLKKTIIIYNETIDAYKSTIERGDGVLVVDMIGSFNSIHRRIFSSI